MIDKENIKTDFVEMKKIPIEMKKIPVKQKIEQKITITKINHKPRFIILTIALSLSLLINYILFTFPEMIFVDNSTCIDELDECIVAMQGSDDRIMNCLVQRAQEMSLREEAVGDCIAELKATEIELELYKKDAEKDFD
tara:strand:- start:3934 stop:4350 length:417 start_codon:yes stop_codon:yes gene_type:complete